MRRHRGNLAGLSSVSTGAYLISLLQERIVQELELERFGYRVMPKDPAFFSRSFPTGGICFSGRTKEKRWQRSRSFPRGTPRRIRNTKRIWSGWPVVVESLLLVTPPELPPRKPGDFIEYLKLLGRFRKLGAREITGLVKIFTQSAADFLDEWFESPEIKVTLATDGVIGANGGPRSAGTAYILMHHCMGGVAGKRGLWGFVKGGMGAVSEAIAASARSQGRGDPDERAGEPGADARWPRAWRRAGEWRRVSRATSWRRISIPKSTFLKLVDAGASGSRISCVDRALSRGRHIAQDESRA